jgi:hypothetical protein
VDRDRSSRRSPALLARAAAVSALIAALVVAAVALADRPASPRASATASQLRSIEISLGSGRAGRQRVDAERAGRKPAARKLPTAAGLRAAWSYARERGGLVSIAVVDTEGHLRGRREDRRYVCASVVKAMLLAAELERLAGAGEPLDAGTAQTLRAMITYSDNAAAAAIYDRVGDEGLYAVARSAGMKRFTVSGYWANAQITAAGMAGYFAKLDRVLAGPHREFALGLLGSVIPEQSWGVPDAAGERWAVRFKGGWRQTELGSLVHQAAQLRHRGRQLSIAVLSDGQPSQQYAIETVRGVAGRLLDAT